MLSIKNFLILGLLGSMILSTPIEAVSSNRSKQTGGTFGAGVGATVVTAILLKMASWWVGTPRPVRTFSDIVVNAKVAIDKVTADAKALEAKAPGFKLTDAQMAQLETGAVVDTVFSGAQNLGIDGRALMDYIKGTSGDTLLDKLTTTDGIVKTLVSDDSVTGIRQGADPDVISQKALKFAVEKGITSTADAGRFVDQWKAQIPKQPAVQAEGGFNTGAGRASGAAVSQAADDFAQLRNGLAQAGMAGGRIVSNTAQAAAKQFQQGINDLAAQVQQATRVRAGAGSDFDPVKPAPSSDEIPVE